ncbi:tyrosine-type recombinase/integrase [Vibrio sp. M260118]|uniref:tyrosine-type recombinase/integrase n=1 Tax=Vibrio sp. M260118 TaxID=3020896 RepID=UPI002F3FE9EA
MPLSDSKLRALMKGHDKDRPTKHVDGRGLHVKAFSGGTVTFYFRYKYNGKDTECKLGNYNPKGSLSLGEARKKAEQCKAWLADGRDPKTELKINRLKIREAATVRQSLEYWLDKFADKNRSNADKHRQQFERHIFPFIGELPLEEVTTRHWLSVFDDIREGKHYRAAPVAAGYIFVNVKQALIYCRKHHFATTHALDDLTVTDAGERQGKKNRVLSQSEVSDLWAWCHNIKSNWYYAQLAKLLLSFGARTQEVRLSQIKEWDLDSMVWTVPAEHNKVGKKAQQRGESGDIVRPIPDGLKKYIQTLIEQAQKAKSPYLLGELKQSPAVAAWGGLLHKKLDHDKWNLHDLRRTLSTNLNEMDVPPHIAESLLGHTLGGVHGIYNRAQYLEQKRSALNLWQSKLNGIEEELTNVINFK